jgi:K+-sensing histidine kinase KdpD
VIINTKKPLFHSTYAESKAWYTLPEHTEYVGAISSSWVGVPMIVKDKTIGVIATYHLEKEYLYDGNDLEFLQAMANQAAIAIEAARSFSDVQNRIEDLETVNIIAQAISTKVGASDLLQTIVSQLREHLKCTHCAIFFPEKIGKETFLVSQYTDGDYAQEIKSRKFKLGKGIAGWCFDHGEEVLLNDAATDPRFEKARARGYDPRSLLVVPVKEKDKVIGVISADHNKANGFDEGDLRLVETISGHISIALEKGRSYEQITRLYQEARSDAIAAKQLATLGTAIAALQHRINNTLNIIIPNIKRLRSRIDVTDPTIEEILEIIERNTRYTSNVLIRIQTPLQEVESSSVNVNALLSDIVGSAKKEWDKNPSHPAVKINVKLDESIPLIHLPVGQISEIIRNLIDNSDRAMQKGGHLAITSKLENDLIYVRIKDTAKGGIPPAIRERLFQKPVPSKEPGHGAGLGLWLSKLMLQGVGGDVTIEETGPTGTTMLIYIPVSASGKEAAV